MMGIKEFITKDLKNNSLITFSERLDISKTIKCKFNKTFN